MDYFTTLKRKQHSRFPRNEANTQGFLSMMPALKVSSQWSQHSRFPLNEASTQGFHSIIIGILKHYNYRDNLLSTPANKCLSTNISYSFWYQSFINIGLRARIYYLPFMLLAHAYVIDLCSINSYHSAFDIKHSWNIGYYLHAWLKQLQTQVL